MPRDEMIGAIIGFAATQCGKLDELLPELFAAHCKDPTGGFVVHLMARAALASRSDAALRELCRKHGISECQTREETSRGQPVLVPDITVAVRPQIASWSPDNRFLLFQDGGREPRVLDTASGNLVDKPLQKRRAEAFAWSPDGKLAALISLSGGLHVLSVGSWEEVSTGLPTNGCLLRGQRHMAFTADSRSLWVLCGVYHSVGPARVAQKLSVPELRVEDEVLLPLPVGAVRMGFSALSIAHHANDVVVTGALYRYQADKMLGDRGIIAISLTRKLPVYSPLAAHSFIRHSDDLSRVLLYTVRTTGAIDKQHGNAATEWAVETWDTASGKQVGRFSGTTDADSTRTLPVAVPMSNLLIAAYSKRSSSRGMLVVMDDRSGAVLQEIGPMPSVRRILVSPDGSRAAIYGHKETRIYKVNR